MIFSCQINAKKKIHGILFLRFFWPNVRKKNYHLWVESFSQLSFDSKVYTKSAAVADFVYTSETNESCEKHLTQRW